jgi:RES domain
MPLSPPPANAGISPSPILLTARTQLWRVHKKHWPGADFKDVVSDPHFGGSRFDSTSADPYSYLYAAAEEQTALLETLVRGIPFNDRGARLIRRAAIADYRISALELAGDLTLISLLTTADLAAACQDEWLIHSSPADYPQTRRWAQWLRSQAPWAQGLAWPSARDLGRQSVVLFGDRCPADVLRAVPGTAVDLDDAGGAVWLNARLAPYRISVRPPLGASSPGSKL